MNKYYGLKPGTITKQELEHTATVRDVAASFTNREEVSIEEGLERAGIIITSKNYLGRYSAVIQAEEDAYYSVMREAAKDALIDGVMKVQRAGSAFCSDDHFRGRFRRGKSGYRNFRSITYGG